MAAAYNSLSDPIIAARGSSVFRRSRRAPLSNKVHRLPILAQGGSFRSALIVHYNALVHLRRPAGRGAASRSRAYYKSGSLARPAAAALVTRYIVGKRRV